MKRSMVSAECMKPSRKSVAGLGTIVIEHRMLIVHELGSDMSGRGLS